MKADEKRRYIKRVYHMAEVKLREIFEIPDNELIVSFDYDKPNSRLVLKTLCDFDKSKGDIDEVVR